MGYNFKGLILSWVFFEKANMWGIWQNQVELGLGYKINLLANN